MPEEKPVKEVQSLSNFVKEDKGNNTIRNAAIAGTLAVGTVVAAVGLGAFRGSEPTPSVPPPPDKTAAAASPTPPEKTVIATPTGKVEVTVSPSPEIKSVPCQVVEQKYCEQAVVIRSKNAQGQDVSFIGLNLPPGTPIRARVDGQLSKAVIAEGSRFKGTLGHITGADGVNYNINGDVQYSDMISRNVKAGDIIGTVGNNPQNSYQGFNVVLDYNQLDRTQGRLVSSETIYQNDFPAAYRKPPVIASFQGGSGITVVNEYGSK